MSDKPEQKPEDKTEPKPKPEPTPTSFDSIVEGLRGEIKTLQTKLAGREDKESALKEHNEKLSEIVRKLGEIKQPPQIKQGESLLDVITAMLGWD